MGLSTWLLLSLLLPSIGTVPVDTEQDLPPYLRGIGWRKVDKELRKNFRLTSSVRPISYDIHLNVSVRGYQGAERSTFHGSVSIVLNVSSPVNTIELHSVGLQINKAELITPSSVVQISEIVYNRERETAIFTLPTTLQQTSAVHLKVEYNGTAQMRGVGLYESWTKNERIARPTISLVTNCEPTGARRWIPCFDEPDKKAEFRLTVVHPSALTAYSNTEGESRILTDGLTKTTFDPTVALPTYVVALGLTEQPVVKMEHNGQKLSVIGRSYNSKEDLHRLNSSIEYVKNIPALRNVTFIPLKTDWLIVEDFPVGAMENPGLITSTQYSTTTHVQIHELVHMYFGNLVTLKSWEQIWLNEGFANYYQDQQYPRNSLSILSRASMHESAMHQPFSYMRSQFLIDHFMSNSHVHYQKAGQLISLMRRFIGDDAFDAALNRYLIHNSFGNGQSETLIDFLAENNPRAGQILRDWVYQSGVALLTVERESERVVIQQRRFLKTDFIEGMRDYKTRWTIPLYYKINGKDHMTVFPKKVNKLFVNIPVNGTFTIDESYPYLYAVYYTSNSHSRRATNDVRHGKVERTEIENAASARARSEWMCNLLAPGKSKEQLWEMYLIQGSHSYITCDKALLIKENAKRYLHDLLVTNELPIRNSDVGAIASTINAFHPGILIDLISEEHPNLHFLDRKIWNVIQFVTNKEANGLEKLHDIVRANPSFAANFCHILTRIFEEAFIQKELQSFDPSNAEDIVNDVVRYL